MLALECAFKNPPISLQQVMEETGVYVAYRIRTKEVGPHEKVLERFNRCLQSKCPCFTSSAGVKCLHLCVHAVNDRLGGKCRLNAAAA